VLYSDQWPHYVAREVRSLNLTFVIAIDVSSKSFLTMNAKENIWSDYRDKLAGGWRCISFEVFDATGPTRKMIAKPDTPAGRVLLSPNGYISAMVMGMGCYTGYLSLFRDENGLYWQTTVDASLEPTRIGRTEERRLDYFEEGGKEFMELQPVNEVTLEVSINCSLYSRQLNSATGRDKRARCAEMGKI
jgi:hypothetical protein